MARGILYHISINPDDMNAVDAQCFYGDENAMHVEYFEDRSQKDAKYDIQTLCNNLRSAGLDIVPIDSGYKLTTNDAASVITCQMAYFEKALANLKDIVNKMSLETFATDITCPYTITQHVQDEYADAVYLDMGNGGAPYTLDGFVRRLEPNRTYYISGNTILMH